MRTRCLLLLSIIALGGCAEAVYGPRVVVADRDLFYIRYLPWRDSSSGVAILADSVCVGSGRMAVLQNSERFAWLDLRYSTFLCTEPPTAGVDTFSPGA